MGKHARTQAAETSGAGGAPRDARIIEDILRSMGVQQWEPRVVNQLMEFEYRYTAEVLQEAQVYAEYAGHAGVELDDVKLAVRAITAHSFTSPPSREVFTQLAQTLRNPVALKPVHGRHTLRLPPDEFTLTTPGWQVKLPERRPDSDVLVKGGEDGEKRARVSKAATAGAEGGGKVSFSLGAKAPAP